MSTVKPKGRMVSRLLVVAFSMVTGFLINWFTGRYPTPFAKIEIDVVGFGAPLTYAHLVIPSGFLSYDWFNFILDLVFWTVMIYLIINLVSWINSGLTPRYILKP